jgi:hypothetical protein
MLCSHVENAQLLLAARGVHMARGCVSQNFEPFELLRRPTLGGVSCCVSFDRIGGSLWPAVRLELTPPPAPDRGVSVDTATQVRQQPTHATCYHGCIWNQAKPRIFPSLDVCCFNFAVRAFVCVRASERARARVCFSFI